MSVVRSLAIIGGIVAVLGIALPRLAPAGGAGMGLAEAAAQTRNVLPTAPADTARVRAFLSSVRGASPLVCGLAGRVVEGRHGWSRIQPSLGGSAGGGDAADLARWAMRGRFDASVVEPLARALTDPGPCVRAMAARLLGRTESAEAVARLQSALNHADAETRKVGALGLGIAESEDAVPPLVRALEDRDAGVRATAAWALGEIEDRAAVMPLVSIMRDADRSVRLNAVYALGEIEDPRANEPLARALAADRDPEVRRAAAWALGNLD
ncbi:MAG: HEAT repeat domain-containing protein [Gemmatimonadales bacterium]|nr:HEAT repeat domain-containing protein [Gemmatimonadales bacterium]